MNNIDRLKNMNITIAGLGMEGGSMALAIREWIKPKKLYGISRTENTVLAAEALGAIDKGSIYPEDILPSTDLLILNFYFSYTKSNAFSKVFSPSSVLIAISQNFPLFTLLWKV